MKRSKPAITVGALLLAATSLMPPASHAEKASAAQSGFLGDYSRLEKAGMPPNHYYVYRDAQQAGYSGKTVYLTPAVVYPTGATFPSVDPAVADEVLKEFDLQLRQRLIKRGGIAEVAAGADMVLQVAVTQVVSEEKGKTVVDLVPARAVMNVAKEVALGEPLVAATWLEAKLVDARSGKVIAELIQHSPGKGIGRSGSEKTHVTIDALRPAIADSAKLVAEQMIP
jgi:hypothetical protein